MKCVAVESTPSTVASFSETNPATFCRLGARHKYEQIVAAGHEIARFNLVETADALGETVEAAAAFRRDAHLDDGAHRACILTGEIQHRAIAQQDALLAQIRPTGGRFRPRTD